MPIASPVLRTPEIVLVRWQLIRDSCGFVHAVGFHVAEAEGRASSAVERCDGDARRLITHSGRVYQLDGPPGYDPDAMYVWQCWCALLGVDRWLIVTPEHVPSTFDERQKLLGTARRYLDDARNEATSLHTRYSSACNALVHCYLAGVATASDREIADDFERQRYDIENWPTQVGLDRLLARLGGILE